MACVSIVIPTYESQATVARCLSALRNQTFRDFEVIVVDSSPGRRTRDVLAGFPEARQVCSRRRLLPFAARELGFRSARGEILVSTDPDVYPAPDWLERLVALHRRTGSAVAGSVACFGRRFFDWGVHFCKYHASLPGRPAARVDSAASANLLLTRKMYKTVGPVPDDSFSSDFVFTQALVARGFGLWFEPGARVSHHHLVGWREYIVERFVRGKDFGRSRAVRGRWSKARLGLWLLISVLPLRLTRLLLRTGRTAQKGGVTGLYLRTLPVVAAGFAAWLAGEAAAYLRELGGNRRRRDGGAVLRSFRPGRAPGMVPARNINLKKAFVRAGQFVYNTGFPGTRKLFRLFSPEIEPERSNEWDESENRCT
jgi:glycosyltransferase involved in cell wall biosynthesis